MTQTAVVVQGRAGLLSTSAHENISVVQDAPIPQPSDNEALVKMLLSPVHPYDIHQIAAASEDHREPPKPLPFVAGVEGLGEILSSSGAFKKGQRVIAVPWPSGTWQQYMAVPEKTLMAVPDGVSDEAAAQFWANPLTALGLMEDAAVPQGQYLLQTAAGSVLGRMVIALAKRSGVKTINVVRRSAQKQELLDIGGDVVIATDKEDMLEKVVELTDGQGAYAALDAVAGPGFQQVLASVQKSGLVISYGILSSSQITLDVMPLLRQAKKVHGWTLFDWLMRDGEDGAKRHMQHMWELFLDGTIEPLTGTKYPLHHVLEAIKESEREARGGKVILRC
ncbi:g4758 [Coccomyxa viridis]|uniref:G4758 protein n=1 Tax=Coccomyxa viridis TaxID=1274662 RepID=A0ABP1FR33_9CHLO